MQKNFSKVAVTRWSKWLSQASLDDIAKVVQREGDRVRKLPGNADAKTLDFRHAFRDFVRRSPSDVDPGDLQVAIGRKLFAQPFMGDRGRMPENLINYRKELFRKLTPVNIKIRDFLTGKRQTITSLRYDPDAVAYKAGLTLPLPEADTGLRWVSPNPNVSSDYLRRGRGFLAEYDATKLVPALKDRRFDPSKPGGVMPYTPNILYFKANEVKDEAEILRSVWNEGFKRKPKSLRGAMTRDVVPYEAVVEAKSLKPKGLWYFAGDDNSQKETLVQRLRRVLSNAFSRGLKADDLYKETYPGRVVEQLDLNAYNAAVQQKVKDIARINRSRKAYGLSPLKTRDLAKLITYE